MELFVGYALLPARYIFAWRLPIRSRLFGQESFEIIGGVLKNFLAIIVAIAGVSAAQAADLPARTYTKAPMLSPASASSWTGFYVGLGAGYGVSDTRSQNLVGGAFFNDNGDFGGRGYVGRVFGGYDHQITPSFVVGVLADGEWSNIKGRGFNVNSGIPVGGTAPFNARQAWAVGARIGYLVNPQTMTYLNGGYTEAEFRGGSFTNAAFGNVEDLNRPNATYSGYFLGGGVEYAFAPGWFAKTEYRYADYSAVNNTLVITSTGAASATTERNQPVVQTVVGGISYKFNWAGLTGGRY